MHNAPSQSCDVSVVLATNHAKITVKKEEAMLEVVIQEDIFQYKEIISNIIEIHPVVYLFKGFGSKHDAKITVKKEEAMLEVVIQEDIFQ